MQNFGDFLRKYSRILLLLILLGISVVLIYYNNHYQRVIIFGAVNSVSGNMQNKYAEISNYFHLKEQNDYLARENALLRARLMQDQQKLFHGARPVLDTVYQQVYAYIPGMVINNSVDKDNNYLTLNIGSNHGVKKDMGVISPLGAVGIVKNVSPNFSVCLSLLHRKFKLNARIKGGNEFGSLSWKGSRADELILDFIPAYTDVNPGDTVETTSFSTIFPQGIPVGTVISKGMNADEGYLTLTIKPMQSLRSVNHIYVIDYLRKNEQDSLELNSRPEDE